MPTGGKNFVQADEATRTVIAKSGPKAGGRKRNRNPRRRKRSDSSNGSAAE